MRCVRTAFLLLFAAAAIAAEPPAAPSPSDAIKRPPILVETPPEAGERAPRSPAAAPSPNEPSRARPISPAVGTQLAAVAPKYDAATAQEKPAELTPDLRETDKPRNTIIRLPNYIVRPEKPPVFKERELQTPKARRELALRKYPGLNVGSFWIFRNDGIGLAMLAEEERLEQKREFEDLVSLMRITDPAAHDTAKREVEKAFLRERDFGR
jgi:hypothetical protein